MKDTPDNNKKLRVMQLRDKYANEGFAALSESERLELLLSYAGCSDNGCTAERLLNAYGSINALADADAQLLMKETGINQQAAVLLKLIPAASRALYTERFMIRSIKDTNSAKNFFASYFIGESDEKLLLTAVSKLFRVEKTTPIAFGTSAQATTSYRNIAELVVKSSCNIFFIAHNHPIGTAQPSESDILFTQTVIKELSRLGVILADHIIIGANDAVSLRESGLVSKFSIMPLKGYTYNKARK